MLVQLRAGSTFTLYAPLQSSDTAFTLYYSLRMHGASARGVNAPSLFTMSHVTARSVNAALGHHRLRVTLNDVHRATKCELQEHL